MKLMRFETHSIKTIDEIYYNKKLDEKLDEKTKKAIKNAWINSVILDSNGRVWIETSKIYVLLRTTHATAKYLLQRIPSDRKINTDENTYIMGCEFLSLLDEYLQQATTGSKRQYMKFSQNLYLAIRDSDTAEKLRYQYSEIMNEKRKKLKNQRIKMLNIEYDELTKNPLDKKKAEFSHIRSYALFPNMRLEINNGLIVNKEVHSIITDLGIMDEDELYDLCLEREWSIGWYDSYIEFIGE